MGWYGKDLVLDRDPRWVCFGAWILAICLLPLMANVLEARSEESIAGRRRGNLG